MKKLLKWVLIIFIVLLAIAVIMPNDNTDAKKDAKEKGKQTITELFEAEGGVAAFQVSWSTFPDFYEIIDFNEKTVIMFRTNTIAYNEYKITEIADREFIAEGRKYFTTGGNGLSRMEATPIKRGRSSNPYYLKQIDLEEVQQMATIAKENAQN